LSIFIKIAWYSAKTTIFEIGYTQHIRLKKAFWD